MSTTTSATSNHKAHHTHNDAAGSSSLDSIYSCQHGGPGELTAADKRLFVLSYEHHRAAARKVQGLAQYQEIIAAELVVLEAMVKEQTPNNTFRQMIDASLMKLYFGQATAYLLQGELDAARIYARMGVYLAMYLKHGETFWELTQLDASIQQTVLQDMYLALGHIASDSGLPRLLNQQTPCHCIEQALPAIKENK